MEHSVHFQHFGPFFFLSFSWQNIHLKKMLICTHFEDGGGMSKCMFCTLI